MKKRSMKRALSAVLTLCMALPGASVAFGSASAATVSDDSSTSASSTAAGSLVEDDGFTWDNANVYFLLTDRFKNGNTANDHSYGRTLDKDGKPLDGWDTNPGTFHGGDFAGVTQSIEEGYFDNLGVNAIWISAPYEQTHGYCDSGKGFAHYSYHGYYVLDYTETDANFGTKEEFKTLVDTAHEHGIRVIMDIVMNHTGYNTVADMEQFGFGTLLDGALDFKYKLTDVGEVNDHIDYKTSEEDWGKWWSNDWIRSGLPGYTEGAGGDLTMSLSGLPDFRTEQTKKVTIPPILETKWKQEGTYDQKLAKYGDEFVQDSHLLPVNFGQPITHRYYLDSTTYMMGVVKDLIAPFDEEGRPHKPEILLPDDNDLIGQLSCRKYSFTSNSKQKVESKKDMKDRGLTSPDEADCILLVCLPMTYKKKGGKK